MEALKGTSRPARRSKSKSITVSALRLALRRGNEILPDSAEPTTRLHRALRPLNRNLQAQTRSKL
jgi:hypothetical protein